MSCAPQRLPSQFVRRRAQGISQGYGARSCVATLPRFAVSQVKSTQPQPRLQAVQGINPPCTALASVFYSFAVKGKASPLRALDRIGTGAAQSLFGR